MEKPIIFAGTPEFAADHLQALIDSQANIAVVVTQPDRPAKRGNRMQMSPVKKLALANQIEVLQPDRLAAADIRNFDARIMVVVAYGQILKPDLIDIPELGCINVHASALPRWRGAAPIQRAIQSGDSETGITLIQINSGLDTGKMLKLERIPILPTDTAATLEARLSILGQKMLVEVLGDIDNCLAGGEEQDNTLATYANKVNKDETQIRWVSDAEQIARNVRAFNPEPVAWCLKGDMRVRLWEAVSDTDDDKTKGINISETRQPGKIISLTKKGLKVACGTGCLNITCLQLPLGKGKPLSPQDLINSRAKLFEPGSYLT